MTRTQYAECRAESAVEGCQRMDRDTGITWLRGSDEDRYNEAYDAALARWNAAEAHYKATLAATGDYEAAYDALYVSGLPGCEDLSQYIAAIHEAQVAA